MGDLFESVLSAAVLALVVGPLTAWIVRRGAKERKAAPDSLNRFTVRTPKAFRLILAVCAVLFELVMLAVYAWQGLSLGAWDSELMWFGHALALVGLGMWLFASMPQLDVDGDSLTIRNFLGQRKSAAFSKLTHAVMDTQMMHIVLFINEGAWASVSLEGTCSINLLARLEEEGIEIQDGGRPITKLRLCWQAIKPLTLVFLGIAAITALVLVFMTVFAGTDMHMLSIVPFLFVLIGVLLPLIMACMPLRGILRIGAQERELGFSFAEDMAERGATGTSLEDQDWFIEISNMNVVAFRRDYLKRVGAPEHSEYGDRCIVATKGGRKLRVYGAMTTLADLRSWFKNGPRDKTAAEAAEDALETIEQR